MHCANSTRLAFNASDRDMFFAAGGHNGKQSRDVLKNFAESLGLEYIRAESKEEYLNNLNKFTNPDRREKPLLFEIFINMEDDDATHNATQKLSQLSSHLLRIW